MKKSLLILLVLFLAKAAESQVAFCPQGAQWRYLFYNSEYSFEYTNEDIKYVGDTTVNNEPVKMLRYGTFFKTPIEDYCHKVFIKQKGDTVFMKNCMTNGTWQILYNFATPMGQSWTTTVKDSSLYGYGTHVLNTYTVIVDAVTTVTINNTSLKKLFVTYCYHSIPSGTLDCYSSEIVERIGCTTCLFNYTIPPQGVLVPALSDFLCYTDNTFATVLFSDKQCDYNVGIRENKLTTELSLFPQPADQQLTIEMTGNSTSKNYTVQLTDVTGRSVLVTGVPLLNSRLTLDVSALQSGLYYLRLLDQGTPVGSGKMIKE